MTAFVSRLAHFHVTRSKNETPMPIPLYYPPAAVGVATPAARPGFVGAGAAAVRQVRRLRLQADHHGRRGGHGGTRLGADAAADVHPILREKGLQVQNNRAGGEAGALIDHACSAGSRWHRPRKGGGDDSLLLVFGSVDHSCPCADGTYILCVRVAQAMLAGGGHIIRGFDLGMG